MLDLLLFIAAFIGHGYLLTVVLNVLYSRPIHKQFLKAWRLLSAIVIFGVPILFIAWHGLGVWEVLDTARTGGEFSGIAIYLVIVLTLAIIAVPLVTFIRLLRRDPTFVRSESRLIDVAKELGHRPVGDGKHAKVADWSFNDIFRVEFTTLTMELPGLPREWEGLTILHLSDLHFYGTPGREYFDFVMNAAMAEGTPDIVAVTGDIVDGKRYIEWIGQVLKRLRWNISAFAILGNHDWWQDFNTVRKELGGLGMRVISNRWEQIEVRGRKMTVIGHEGPWFRPAPDLAGCPAGDFRLLLSHSPDNIGWARRNNVHLMLSGHNHGGQIRIPIAGSIFVPSLYSRRYDMGTFHEPPTTLHVNRGLSGKEPLRWRCPPQVTRIVLKAKRAAD